MIRDNVLAVADAIERETVKGLGFDMTSFISEDPCGTTACIAGWCTVLAGRVAVEPDGYTRKIGRGQLNYHRIGKRFLGLTSDQASALFYEGGTRRQAINCLRRLAETDEVVWKKRG